MRILHVIPFLGPRHGGPSKAGFEMARAVARRGHAVSIFTTDKDGPGRLDVPFDTPVMKDGVEIRYFPIQPPIGWAFSAPMARALRRAIPQHDVVHSHSLYFFPGMVAGHYCRKYRVPYLIRPHGTLDPYMWKRHRVRKTIIEWAYENRNLSHAAAIHYTAEEERQISSPYVPPGARALVVPNGIDEADYRDLPEAGAFRAKYPVVGDKKIILFLSRITFKKGLDLLSRAYARIARSRSDVHLVIAGTDDEGHGDEVRGWLRDGGVFDRVTFTGHLEGRDKLAAFRDAHVFALPSYSENFGIAVIEALICGLPVVISDKVNIWREIEGAQAGRVVPCDPGALETALRAALDDTEGRTRMGESGRALVKRRFLWPQVAETLESVYGSVALRPPANHMRAGWQLM